MNGCGTAHANGALTSITSVATGLPEGTRIAGHSGGGGRDPAPSEHLRGAQPCGMLTTMSFCSVMLRTAKRGPSRVLPLSLTPP